MAQGKLKVKAKNSGCPLKKKGSSRAKASSSSGGVAKRGCRPKSSKGRGSVQRALEKAIHENIEQELATRAAQLEEGKAFKCIPTPTVSKQKDKKRK